MGLRRRTSRDTVPRRIGLRSRTMIAFGAGAALVSMTLAVVTYSVAQHYLLSRRESGSVTQAFIGASFVQQELQSRVADVPDILSSLVTPEGTQALLYRHGRWYSPSVTIGQADIPLSFTAAVRAGHVAEQRIIVGGTVATAVGVPLPSTGGDFFEIRSLGDLEQTLSTLGTILAATALATTIGGCLLGWWASRRLTRPLTEVTTVATAIAGGALDRRLPIDNDPDLDSLATAFNGMVTSLEQRNQRDARFVSDVSHELRSPLTAMTTSVDLMEMHRRALPPTGQRALDLLHVEVNRFSTMVQDLLEISRMDAGATGLDVEEVPLDELVVRTLAGRGSAVPVEISPRALGVWVQGDKRRLQRSYSRTSSTTLTPMPGVLHV